MLLLSISHSIVSIPVILASKFPETANTLFLSVYFISAPSALLNSHSIFPIFLAHLTIPPLSSQSSRYDGRSVRIRRQMVIMRDPHNQRLVLFPDDPLHQFQHIHRRVRIQIQSARLQNDLEYHQRPCNADTLLLPAGHLVRHMIADFFPVRTIFRYFPPSPAPAARHHRGRTAEALHFQPHSSYRAGYMTGR